MSTTETGPGPPTGTTPPATPPPTGEPTKPDPKESNGDKPGDPGLVSALDVERKARHAAETKVRNIEAELAKLREQAMTDAEKAVAKAHGEGKAEALGIMKRRLVESGLMAAAAGVLIEPTDAPRFIDVDKFTVSDDGALDMGPLRAAVEQLAKDNDRLAVKKATGAKPAPLAQPGYPPQPTGASGDDWLRGLARRGQ